MAANGSSPGASAPNKIDADMVKQWKKRNTAQMKKIRDSCNDNFELQAIVLFEIEKYEKFSNGQDGVSLAGAVQLATRKKPKEQVDWDVVPSGKLERYAWLYSRWANSLITKVVMYSDASLRDLADSPVWKSKDSCKQCLIYAWDIRCSGPDCDYVGEPDQGLLFPLMKEVYIEKGSRLTEISGSLSSSTIEWTRVGVYSIALQGEEGNKQVTLRNKFLDQAVTLQEGLVPQEEISKIDLQFNWSQFDAKLSIPSDSWVCAQFFPTIVKTMKKSEKNTKLAICRAKSKRMAADTPDTPSPESAEKKARPGTQLTEEVNPADLVG